MFFSFKNEHFITDLKNIKSFDIKSAKTKRENISCSFYNVEEDDFCK